MSKAAATLRITAINAQTADIALFTMMPAVRGEQFPAPAQPGQVAILQVGAEAAYFACAHAPHETDWQFLVKRGRGASGQLFASGIGSEITLQKIVGRGFDVAAQRGRDLVFVAMGTGVAPLRSALRHVLRERDAYGRLIFLYGARTNAELCFADEAEAMRRSRVEIVVTVTESDTPTNERRYVQHLLDRFLPQMPQPTALICGSPAMMEDTRARLLAHAVAPEAILTNY